LLSRRKTALPYGEKSISTVLSPGFYEKKNKNGKQKATIFLKLELVATQALLKQEL